MALQSQLIDVPLGGGKQDERTRELVDPPGILAAINVDPSKLGGYVQRREPFTLEPAIGTVGALVRRDAGDVLAFSDTSLGQVEAETIGAAVLKYADGVTRKTSAVVASVSSVLMDLESTSHTMSVTYVARTGYTAYYIVSYNPVGSNGYALVIDEHGTVIGRQEFADSDTARVELASSPLYGVAFWQDGAAFYGQRFDPSTATWDARVTISASGGLAVAWPHHIADVGFVVVASSETPKVRIVSEALAITASRNAAGAASTALAVYVEGDTISVVGVRTAGVTYFEDLVFESFAIVSSTSVTAQAASAFEWNVAEDRIPLRIAIAGGSAESEVLVFIQSDEDSETNDNGYARVNTLTAAWSDSHKCPDLRIAHRGYSAGRVGIVLDPDSVDPVVATVQIDDDNHAEIVAYLSPGLANTFPKPLTDFLTCSAFVETSSGSYVYVVPALRSGDEGMALVKLTPRAFRSASASGTAYIGGDVYDGEVIASPISMQAPHVVSLTGVGSGGALSNGTYLVRFAWIWDDRNGNRHESAPSIAESITLSGGGSSQSIACVVRPPVFSERPTRVQLATYMTAAGGTLFYRAGVGTVTEAVCLFFTGADRINETITGVGSTLSLYTDSGELENAAPPPTDETVWHGNRLWCISGEDGSLWPSKLIRDGYGVAWNSSLAIANPRRERPIALATLGDRLAVFYPDAIGLVYGEGPDNLGQGGSFSPITIVHHSIGAKSREVTNTSLGVMFQAGQSLAVLDAGGGLAPLPQIEDVYRSDGVADALLVGVAESAIDTSILTLWSNGEAWLYNLRAQAWSRSIVEGNEGLLSVPSRGAVWRGEAAFSSADGIAVLSKTLGTLDRCALTTAWIKVGGLQGFQRVRRVWVKMEIPAAGGEAGNPSFEVAVHYDYSLADRETFSFLYADVSSLPGFPLISLPLRIAKQRCSAIAVSVGVPTIDADDNGVECASPFRVIGVRLEVGVLGRQRRNTAPAATGGA